MSKQYKGIDISKWNTPDSVYNYIKELDFVIIRGGYGRNNIDPLFKSHYNRCVSEEKPYGIYWFSYALSEELARLEAQYCWKLTQDMNIKPSYPIYFDFEYDSADYFKKQKGRAITVNEVKAFTEAFCDEIEKLGGYAGFYCNKDYLKRYYSGLTKYTCWLADYKDSSFNNRMSNVHIIQTTNKPLDMDVCKIDFETIIKNKRLNGW